MGTVTATRLPLSYSAIRLHEECPARFKAERIDKIKRATSIPMALGQFLHEVTDRYHKHLVKNKMTSDYEYLDRSALEMWDARDSNEEWRILPELLKAEMLQVLEGIKTGVHIDPAVVVGSEIELAFTVDWKKTAWFAKDVFFRMKIDRLDISKQNVATIWDLKTGRQIKEDQQQNRTYAFGVSLLLKYVAGFRVELFYARNNALKAADVTIMEALQVQDWIVGVSNRVEKMRTDGYWPATPGSACADCPIFDRCPAKSAAAAFKAPERVDEAEELVGKYILVERERQEILEKLKAFVDENGPVETNGWAAGFRTDEVLEFPVKELYELMRTAGYEIEKFLKGDNTEIKKIAKKDKALGNQLSAIVKIKPKTVFTVAAIKE